MTMRSRVAAAILALSLAASGCVSNAKPTVDPLLAARHAAEDSTDGEVIGRWLLTELVAPGGSPQQARAARTRLDGVAKDEHGLYASLARGVDDEAHGAMNTSARAYLAALDAARTHDSPDSELVAAYVATRLMLLRANVNDLWKQARPTVEKVIDHPTRAGFRARADLVEWWLHEMRKRGAGKPKQLQAEAEKKLGCLEDVRFAGPFGRPAPLDLVTKFDAEKPGVWPTVFPAHPARSEAPRVIASERGETVCTVRGAEAGGPGMYYVETFFELEQSTDVLLSVRAAWSVLVDDVEILAHDPRDFGTWATNTVALRLGSGRHRIVGRLGSPETALRLTDRYGTPIAVKASSDPSRPISLEPPRVLGDPQVLASFYAGAGVPHPRGPGAPSIVLDPADPVLRFVAAELAHIEGNHDLATVIVEPLVKEPSRATPIALAQAAMYLENDPIFAANDARDLALDYRRRATEKDARLWYPALWLMVDAASKEGGNEQLLPLSQLAIDFSEVATVGKSLANLYARLGYRAEHKRTIGDLSKRFPDDVELLRLQLSILDDEGKRTEADALAKRIEGLEPESTITVERAIARNDLDAAARIVREAAEGSEGTSKNRLLRRVADLLVRAGKKKETLAILEQALTDDPSNSRANLDLADARFAIGDHSALRRGLAHALRVGADTAELRDAIEAVDGATELEPFRLDPLEAIREFEQSGAAAEGLAKTKGGTAARVLDYAAVWVHSDGSARMLEHEILFMQSEEAIKEHAEQRLPRGKLLRMRVIAKDGSVHEPEIVSGKPTATMAPLEVGDYIETETVFDLPGDGGVGKSFLSPRWFFREERVDYHHSEFVIVAPSDKPFEIETTGHVPDPKVEKHGTFTVRRWRMDRTPAVTTEPFSAPIAEFLPSVRAGWGVSQENVLSRLLDASTRLEPADPRLVRIAKTIVTAGTPADKADAALKKLDPVERARRIYRWVLDNVEPSREIDPRKSVVGKSGSRLEAFLYLSRLVGVDARHAVVQDRLRAPASGPFSDAEQFTEIAVAVPTGKGDDVWTVVADKYAPFGYLPSSLRGQPAIVMRPGLARVTTGKSGPPDGVVHRGKAVLSADGSARLTIDQSYTGRLAIVLREQIQKIGDDEKLRSAVESEILSSAIPGARLASLEVLGMNDLDDPLVLRLDIEVTAFAQKSRNLLVIPPPFSSTVHLGMFATVEKRETPLMIPPPVAVRIEVDMTIELPKGATTGPALAGQEKENDGRTFKVDDRAENGRYVVHRIVDIPAGRISPDAYPSFVAFARAADEALHQDIVVRLP
ncbi:MAG: hypothetical protein HOW73_34375 [Polyangiaceae bacterium]|nr:hypothetical protein [Polyangiaceae bacterium]